MGEMIDQYKKLFDETQKAIEEKGFAEVSNLTFFLFFLESFFFT